jgi:acetyl esterase/lipase
MFVIHSMKPFLIFLLGTVCLAAQPAPQKKKPQAKPKAPAAKQADDGKYANTVPKPTHSEVKYGPHERNVLDFWQAKSDKPTPLVLVIHGGGWMNGSKERVDRMVDVKALLDAGISVAANNYRFIPQATAEGLKPPVIGPLHDSARALQFLRSKAKEWNIDPTRVGLSGSSAGACTSLWLAFHEDLADPKSSDPIARQSTRPLCIAVIGAQTTLDPQQAKEWTPNSRYGGHAFGKKDFTQALAERESILPWIAEYSPYALASKDDPAVSLYYAKAPQMGKNEQDPTHSANYGVGLQKHCKKIGIPCELYYPGATGVKHEKPTPYLIEMLKK